MNEKIIRYTDAAILSIGGLLCLTSLLFPSYLYSEAVIFYKSAIVLCAFIYIMAGKFFKKEVDNVETPVDGALFLLFAWHWIAIIFSKQPVASLNAAVTFSILMLFYYICYSYARKYTGYLAFFLMAIAVFVSVYGIYQYVYGFDLSIKSLDPRTTPFFADIKSRIETKRVFSLFIYPNTFAGFLILLIPPALGLFKTEKKLRPLMAVVLVLMLVNLVLTRSMGAFISLGAAVAIFLFMNDAQLRSYRIMMMIFLAVCAAGLVLTLNFRGVPELMSNMSSKLHSLAYMIRLIWYSFATGYGPGTFETVYNLARPEKVPYLKYAHNALLQTGIELGVPGLLLLLYLVFRAYRSILKNFYFLRTQQTKTFVISFLTGITACLIHNMIDFDMYNLEFSFIFILAAALMMSQVRIGLLELKKFKFTYLLGINPGLRRDIIFYIIISILLLCAVTGGKQSYIFSGISVLIVAGFALWSVSKEDFRRTDLDIPAAAFICFSLLSVFYSPNIHAAIYGIKLILAAATVYYLCSQFLRRSDYRIIITNFIVWLGVLVSITACGQMIYNYLAGGKLVIDAFFPNQNLFAGYLVIPFAVLLSKILLEKKIDYLWVKLGGLALFAFAEFNARSRGGTLSMILVFCLTLLYYNYHRHNVKDTTSRAAFKSVMLKIILAVFVLLAFTRLTPSGEKLTNVKGDPFYFNRLSIYGASLRMTGDKLLTGWGIGSYGSIFPRYNFPIDAPARYQMETNFAHNELLQSGVELGLPGLALALIMGFVIIRKLPSYEGHRKLWASGAGAYFALCGIFFHSLFDFNLHMPGTLLTAAVLASIVVQQRSSISTVTKEALVFTKIHYLPALLLSAVLFSLAVRPAASAFMYSLYKAGYPWALEATTQAEPLNPSYMYEVGMNYEKSGDCSRALNYFQKTTAYDRFNTLALLHSARAYTCIGNLSAAREQYNLALEANPYRAFTYSELADFAVGRLNDRSMAEDYLQKAIELEPNYALARHNLALLLRQKGDYSSAIDQLNTAEFILAHAYPRTEYERSIFDFPGLDVLYFNKALVYHELKDRESSCEYLNKAISLKKSAQYSKFSGEFCGGK